jgi:hypothetical protein
MLWLGISIVASCGGGPPRPPPPPPEFFVPPEIPPSDPRAVQLRGRVLDAAERPLAGVEVLVMGGGHTGVRATTNAAGEFSVSGLPTTLAGYVAVHVKGFAVAARDSVRIAERNPDSVTLRLEPEQVLAGRVLAADGTPLANARVRARGERRFTTPLRKGATWEEVAQIDTVRTDAEGRFRFAGLYPGAFELVASWPGQPERTGRVEARAGAVDVEVRIDPTATPASAPANGTDPR